MKDQLTSADVILINKIDSIDEFTLKEVESSILNFNDSALFFKTSALEKVDDEVFEAMLGGA
ncbi:hypothetical protein IWB18_07780 [Alkalibacter sp. M17DMB]|nr:hypothetical protein [Alkalibacter mobilis]